MSVGRSAVDATEIATRRLKSKNLAALPCRLACLLDMDPHFGGKKVSASANNNNNHDELQRQPATESTGVRGRRAGPLSARAPLFGKFYMFRSAMFPPFDWIDGSLKSGRMMRTPTHVPMSLCALRVFVYVSHPACIPLQHI